MNSPPVSSAPTSYAPPGLRKTQKPWQLDGCETTSKRTRALCQSEGRTSLNVALVQIPILLLFPVLGIGPAGDAQPLDALGRLVGQRVVAQIQPAELAQVGALRQRPRPGVADAAVAQVES